MMAADDKQLGEGLGVRKRINSAEGESALQLLMKVQSTLVMEGNLLSLAPVTTVQTKNPLLWICIVICTRNPSKDKLCL